MIDFSVMKDPKDENTWWDAGGITEEEWDNLFYGSFGCFMGMNEPYIDGEPIENWEERVRTKFQSAIPNYPLLGRMWQIDSEYWYSPEEIKKLLEECLSALDKVSDQSARNALEKIVRACNEAILHNGGLSVVGD